MIEMVISFVIGFFVGALIVKLFSKCLRGPKGDRGAVGPKGDRGKSAYEFVKDHGFTGTEKEFVELLFKKIIYK